jgi:lipopolysaccharide/colanic/teichoic acid biosynthesis glycosyltransferase
MYLSLLLTIHFHYQDSLNPQQFKIHLQIFSFLFIIWILVFYIVGMFELGLLQRYTVLFFRTVTAVFVAFITAIIYFYVQPGLILTPRRFLLLQSLFLFVLIIVWLLILKKFFAEKLFAIPVYFYGKDSIDAKPIEYEDEFKSEMLKNYFLGYKFYGKIYLNNDGKIDCTSADKGFTPLVLIGELSAYDPEEVSGIYALKRFGYTIIDYKEFYELLLRRIYLPNLNQIWLVENIDYGSRAVFSSLKRVIDFILGLVMFCIFILSYPFVALFIKLSSKGPAIFVQERTGKDGKAFSLYKYRTMVQSNGGWTEKGDKRITTIGKFLRATKLDELPQAINLINGTLSLVGPRPEQSVITTNLREQIPYYDERHIVKPGLTGWGQLHIYAASVDETKLKLQYDLYYIKHRSLLLDFEIVLKTIYYLFVGNKPN